MEHIDFCSPRVNQISPQFVPMGAIVSALAMELRLALTHRYIVWKITGNDLVASGNKPLPKLTHWGWDKMAAIS